MRVPHIYQTSSIALNTPVTLDEDAAGHIGRVLRMKVGEHVSIFNGEGGEYLSEIIEVTKSSGLKYLNGIKPYSNLFENDETGLKNWLQKNIECKDNIDCFLLVCELNREIL